MKFPYFFFCSSFVTCTVRPWEVPAVHLVLIWVISEPSPLTCNDSWLDSVEGQLTATEGSSRFKAG